MNIEEIPVPVWFLKHIENTLRIENNINLDKKTGETCQDRNIKQALNGVRKILSGEALTGNERLEPLKPYNAEKDFALGWKDIETIIEIFYSLNKEIRDENFSIEKYGTEKYFTEILNRFNKSKEVKK